MPFLPSTFVKMKLLFASLLSCVVLTSVASPGARAAGQTGVVTLLENFSGNIPAGEEGANLPPVTRPFRASDGNYYGIAPIGGAYGNGIVFKITPSGTYSVLHNFHDDEYSNPLVEEGDQPRVLIQGKDGNLYGVCNDGGLNDDEVYHNGGGTIFMLTLGGPTRSSMISTRATRTPRPAHPSPSCKPATAISTVSPMRRPGAGGGDFSGSTPPRRC